MLVSRAFLSAYPCFNWLERILRQLVPPHKSGITFNSNPRSVEGTSAMTGRSTQSSVIRNKPEEVVEVLKGGGGFFLMKGNSSRLKSQNPTRSRPKYD
jgi:hypothetical protein